MPLSAYAGIAEGLNAGLNNYLKIRQIQDQEQRDRLAEQRAAQSEERALREEERQKVADTRTETTFGRTQAEWTRQHTPSIIPMDVFGNDPDIKPEHKDFLAQRYKAVTGKDPLAMISQAEAKEYEPLVLDDKTKQIINQGKREALEEKIRNATAAAIPRGDEDQPLGSLAQVAERNAKLAEVAALKEKLAVHNASDKLWVIKHAMEHTDTAEERMAKDEARKEKAEVRLTQDQPFQHLMDTSGKAYAVAEKMTDPAEKAKYIALGDKLNKQELEKEKVKHEARGREFAPSDTEKKFNFWKSLYPALSNEEIQKKVVKEDIPSETRYVLDAVKEVQKALGTPEEIQAAEIAARALYRKLTGGVTATPVPEKRKPLSSFER